MYYRLATYPDSVDTPVACDPACMGKDAAPAAVVVSTFVVAVVFQTII